MNIFIFLTPKSEVAYISEEDALRQALEKMEYHKYSAIPLSAQNRPLYRNSDRRRSALGHQNQYHLDRKVEKIPITAIKRLDNRPVKADADMEDLIGKALNQNFVPVLDDQKCFIGIITRKDIIQYFYKKSQQPEEKWPKRQKEEKSETVVG